MLLCAYLTGAMAYPSKMILVFNDADVESMLRAKEDGMTAEELVRKIEEFRLSL
jgi:hypothetical protein